MVAVDPDDISLASASVVATASAFTGTSADTGTSTQPDTGIGTEISTDAGEEASACMASVQVLFSHDVSPNAQVQVRFRFGFLGRAQLLVELALWSRVHVIVVVIVVEDPPPPSPSRLTPPGMRT